MKELDTWDAMQMAFEHYKKDSITVLEFNQWCEKYEKEHPDTYSYICRDDIHHEHDCGRIWWEIKDFESDILHRQETIKCPIDGHVTYKFPNVERFEEIKKKIEKWETIS